MMITQSISHKSQSMPAKSQPTRASIVNAALDLFYHQGFGITSYADISKQTGIAKGNVHYYFRSKNEILIAVSERRIQMIRALLEEWSLDCATPYDCLERFIGMFEANADDLAEYGCPMGTLNGELAKNQPELQRHTRQMFNMFLSWLEEQFKTYMTDSNATKHAEHLMIMAQGVSLVAHVYANPDLVRRHAKNMRYWLSQVCPE
jgi:AcrR family transcriptional regulator